LFNPSSISQSINAIGNFVEVVFSCANKITTRNYLRLNSRVILTDEFAGRTQYHAQTLIQCLMKTVAISVVANAFYILQIQPERHSIPAREWPVMMIFLYPGIRNKQEG
jgi:hypothetical protein